MKTRPLHVERHELGPRLFVFRRRVHEWTVGAGLVVGLTALLAARVLALDEATIALLGLGLWLFVKDRHDLSPARRDRCAWSWGSHRLPTARLRPQARGEWLPPVAAGFAALTALINLDSALMPDLHGRGRLLSHLGQVLSRVAIDDVQPWSHALAVPLSGALLLASVFLAKRRYRAWQGAIALLVALGALNLLKDLAFEEALLSWAAAGVLAWGRPAFAVAPAPEGLRSSARLALGVVLGTLTLSALATTISMPGAPRITVVLRETGDLLLWHQGPVTFSHHLALFPVGIGLVSWGGLLAALWVLFRPLGAPRSQPSAEARRLTHDPALAPGHDIRKPLALPSDKHYLFGPDGRSFLGYRARHGVLLVSGDPVGDAGALRGLLAETLEFAARRGLCVAFLSAGPSALPVYREADMRALYLGDEAVLDTDTFDLESPRMRSVRRAVSQVERAGYRVELLGGDSLAEALLPESDLDEEVRGENGRGEVRRRPSFAKALDSLRREAAPDALVVVARQADGAVAGFVHFVPAFGRVAVSLASMGRRGDTPHGLFDSLVARSMVLLGERGIREVSLSSAVRARYLREKHRVTDHLVASVVRRADRRYRFERLHRFDAKFHPRWEPRYLVYENRRSLARTALAALSVSGRLPTPSRSRRAVGRGATASMGHAAAAAATGGED
jgi:lysyl-tRNA synthetase, class II